MQHSKLFEPGKIGDIEVKNRIFMAPLTRNRAHSNGTPKEMAIEYYAQRASAGLIITEAAQIGAFGKGYIDTPGIYNTEQTAVWKKINDKVHISGGKTCIQLWHVGRISHISLLPSNKPPVAPSAIRANAKTFTPHGLDHVSSPRELGADEISEIVNRYAKSAKLAIDSGFDAIEIHAANGYLINQFISTNSNKRKDSYGGSVENRARFLLEALDAVCKQIGSGRVGVRLSPCGKFNDIDDKEYMESYRYIYKEIEKRNIAFLHIVESLFDSKTSAPEKKFLKEIMCSYQGNYIANGGMSPSEASERIGDQKTFAVAFGRLFISNPDLPERIAQNSPMTKPDPNTFYGGNEKGYTDYPKYQN